MRKVSGVMVAMSLAIAGPMTHVVVAQEKPASGCQAFTWDISAELNAMRREPRNITAEAAATGSGGILELGEHYSVALPPQGGVKFVAEPGRASRSDNPRGGLLNFTTKQAGRYRVSLTSRHWVDVVIGGRVIDSSAHQGNAGCDLLHKIVEFDLPPAAGAVLQISGSDTEVVGLTITGPLPAR